VTRGTAFALAASLSVLAACASVPVEAGAPQEFTIGFGMTARSGSLGFAPQRIEEDSRCPANVQCVQAGTVRLSVLLSGRGTPRTTILRLGAPNQVDPQTWMTLTRVCPYPAAPAAIRRDQYRFTIVVSPIPSPGPAPGGPCPIV
jgi:hypothetical protein